MDQNPTAPTDDQAINVSPDAALLGYRNALAEAQHRLILTQAALDQTRAELAEARAAVAQAVNQKGANA